MVSPGGGGGVTGFGTGGTAEVEVSRHTACPFTSTNCEKARPAKRSFRVQATGS